MSTAQTSVSPRLVDSANLSTLRHQYGCGPVEFAGTENGLYERHLLFDDVVHPTIAGPRERFEAMWPRGYVYVACSEDQTSVMTATPYE